MASSTDLWGTLVSSIQESIVVHDGYITGKLGYVDTGALADGWGPGHFIALDLSDNDFTGLTSVKVGLKPSAGSGLVELIDDPDKSGVFKVTDKYNQRFVIVQSDGNNIDVKEYDLNELEFVTLIPLNPVKLDPAASNRTIQGCSVSQLQNGITIDEDSITGTLNKIEYLEDSNGGSVGDSYTQHVFVADTESSDHYLLALDLNDNSYFGVTSVTVATDTLSPIEIVALEDKSIVIEITGDDTKVVVKHAINDRIMTQEFDVTGLELSTS